MKPQDLPAGQQPFGKRAIVCATCGALAGNTCRTKSRQATSDHAARTTSFKVSK